MATLGRDSVAIFPWGDVIEEFLDPLGLDAEDYARRMRGGWLFGYVAALQRHGRRAVIVYASERRRRPERLIHAETGAAIWLVPGRRSGEGLARGRPSLRAGLQWARTPFAGFARVLRREGCSSLLVQDYEHARFDALVALGRMLRLPVSATFQGGDLTMSPIEARVRSRTLAACQALIVPSARERERLATRYGLPAERLHAIPNPVDTETWRAEPRPAARAALGLDPDVLLVVNHGRIDIQRKGLDVLLAAWRRVAAARPTARLAILGSGQDHDAFAPMVAASPALDWRAGYVTDPPLIRRWLSAADAYVTLSRTEGMPVAPPRGHGLRPAGGLQRCARAGGHLRRGVRAPAGSWSPAVRPIPPRTPSSACLPTAVCASVSAATPAGRWRRASAWTPSASRWPRRSRGRASPRPLRLRRRGRSRWAPDRMPWVAKEIGSPRCRLERRVRRWFYDHGPGVTAAGIGAVCVLAAVTTLKLAGLLG
ncbi:glycosyltransferase [Phenylobacterium sp. J367]|uniref:glycosyltransferase n=1 Tax=Phenylobacterium sp. J367 TaxID=2898435 RepID=UPI002151244D|nr:glycosyltransferase [Phenylobacterium sp. J367]MCR5880657.1 glycosyltransferase [Phenylobacterium sp. J367]